MDVEPNVLDAVRAVADLALATDAGLTDVRAQLEHEVLVVDPGLQAELTRALALQGDAAPRARCFRLLAAHWHAQGVPGGGRFQEATTKDLEALLLRFAPVFRDPKEGKPWRWSLKLATSASGVLREAVADLAANGGTDKAFVRRPRRGLGPKARRVEELLFPDRAQTRQEKGKGKGGKGKGRGKGKKGGKGGKNDGDEGGTPAAPAAAAAPPMAAGGAGAAVGAGPAGAAAAEEAAAAAAGGQMRPTYTGRGASPARASAARRLG